MWKTATRYACCVSAAAWVVDAGLLKPSRTPEPALQLGWTRAGAAPSSLCHEARRITSPVTDSCPVKKLHPGRVVGASVEADSIWDLLFFKPKIRKVDSCMPAFMAPWIRQFQRNPRKHKNLVVTWTSGNGHEHTAGRGVDFGHAFFPRPGCNIMRHLSVLPILNALLFWGGACL